jgi:two-component system, cell cycle sensor histidine kinase and response regulator CckA
MMYLPDLKQPVMPMEALTGSETILLVDDNDSFRKVVSAFLQTSGYNVLEAATVTEAARIARNYHGTINLLLTDIVMPEVNGYQFADYLRFLYPEMTVLYMSGFGDAECCTAQGSKIGARILPKPFGKKTLLLAVGKLLHWRGHPEAALLPHRAWGGISSFVQ